MPIRVTVTTPGFDRMRKILESSPSLRRNVARAWITIYRSFIRRRFVKQSRGGGEWAPLKPATLRRRRGNGAAILRDTSLMFSSLQPISGSGGLMRTTILKPMGFKAELSGGGRYPDGVSLSDVASFHHHGEGNLPAREILVQPDENTMRQLREQGHRIIVEELNDR